MTPGTLNRDIVSLRQRVAALEFNAKRAFKRLLAWSVSAAVVSSALIWFAFR